MLRLLKIALYLSILGVFVGFCVLLFLNSVARKGVEAGAKYALGMPTTLEYLDIGVLGGRTELSGLVVSNPRGFSVRSADERHFLTLESAALVVDVTTLLAPKVVAPRLVLENVDLSLLQRSGTTNFRVALERLGEILGEGDPASASPTPRPKSKTFVIEDLRLKNVTVLLRKSPASRELSELRLEIPEIRLAKVGARAPGGYDVPTVAATVLHAILEAVLATGECLPGDIGDDLRAGLEGLASIAPSVLGDVTRRPADDAAHEKPGASLGGGLERRGAGLGPVNALDASGDSNLAPAKASSGPREAPDDGSPD